MGARAAAVERLDCDFQGYKEVKDVFELMKEKLKWSKQQKRNKINFIPEYLSGTDEQDCEQEEMLINKLKLWT